MFLLEVRENLRSESLEQASCRQAEANRLRDRSERRAHSGSQGWNNWAAWHTKGIYNRGLAEYHCGEREKIGGMVGVDIDGA